MASIPSCALCAARVHSLFRDLSEEMEVFVERERWCRYYARRAFLFFEGESSEGVFCVHQGRVKVYRTTPEGQEQIVRIATPGDLLGYRALLVGGTHTTTAQALEDVHACYFPRAVFHRLLEQEKPLMFRLMEFMGMELNRTEQHLVALARRPVRERLAEVLLYLRSKMGESTISLSREELASLTGAATGTVIRELQHLAGEGLIRLEGRRVELVDVHRLAHLADIQD